MLMTGCRGVKWIVKWNMTARRALLLVAVLAGLAAVLPARTVEARSGQVSVVASSPIVKDIFVKVGGEHAKVISIVRGATCSHEFEPAPGDMREVARCDIFARAGMGFDTWADGLAQDAAGKNTRIVDLSKGVRASGNPHYWGNPENAKIMARNALLALAAANPAQKAYFTRNFEAFVASVDRTFTELKTRVAKLPSRRIVSYSAAFMPLYKAFGFENLLTVETRCEQEVSPRALARAVTLVRARGVRVVVGDAAEPKGPDPLVRETGTRKVLLWTATNASGDYLKTLRDNVERLVTALQ